MFTNKFKFLVSIFLILSVVYSHPKGDTFRKLVTDSPTGVVTLTANTFRDLVMKHPRPYDVVILFTLKYQCKLCSEVKEIFEQVAESVSFVEGYKPDMSSRKRAVFFALVYYSDETNSIFKKLKLPATTSIMYTTPHNIVMDDKGEPTIRYDEDFVIAYKERNTENVMPHKVMEFVNAKSGRKIELKKNPLLFIFYFLVFVMLLVVGFWLYAQFTSFFLNPWLWYVASLMIFITCIGGIVYNINHGAHLAKFDRDGSLVELIYKGQRSQYVLEGIICSSLFVVLGTLLAALTCIRGIRNYWTHRISCIIIMLLVVLVSRIIITIYQKKASWYGPTFMPPSGYIQGPLLKDQGNSF